MVDRTGQQFGNYRLVRLLGRGGFAEVYLGEHIHIQKQVAIKVLSNQLGSTDLERFIREAQTITALEHPHIVRVFDFGIQEEVPFLVMDYAPNGTLRGRHPKGSRVSLDDALSYVRQIAPALQHAHDQHIIHRDVKPENMLLGSQGEILLSDFGIAVTTATTTSHQSKNTAGTVAYMAPEQIMGKPCVASDQYALGVIVYEWLTGEQPFQGSLFEMYGQHLNAPIPSLRKINPDIPAQVEQCIAKALAKNPDERFASIQDFVTVLQESVQANSLTSAPTDLIASEAPYASYIGQDDPTFVKPLPETPNFLELGPDDPTYLNIPARVPVSPNVAPTDVALLKTKVEASRLPNTNQDGSIQKEVEPAIPVTPSFIPILPLSNTPNQEKRVGKTGRRTKAIPVMAVCSLLLLLLAAMPFFPFLLKGVGANPPISRSTSTSTQQVVLQSTPTSGQSNQQPTSTQPPQQSDQQPMQPPQQLNQQPTQPPVQQPTQPPPVQRTLSATKTQASTVYATGQAQTRGTQAKGSLWLYNCTSSPQTFTAGTVYSNDQYPAIQIMLDETATVPGSRAQVAAGHVVQPGAIGNVSKYADPGSFWHMGPNGAGGCPGIYNVRSWTAFTGGTDPQPYTVVQQSDIDNAAAPLKTSTMQNAKTSILQQVQSNEHLVGDIQCSPSTVTSDHNAGDKANQVTVTVTTTCAARTST